MVLGGTRTCNPHDTKNSFPVLNLYFTDPAQSPTTASWGLDRSAVDRQPDHDLFAPAVHRLEKAVRRIKHPPTPHPPSYQSTSRLPTPHPLVTPPLPMESKPRRPPTSWISKLRNSVLQPTWGSFGLTLGGGGFHRTVCQFVD